MPGRSLAWCRWLAVSVLIGTLHGCAQAPRPPLAPSSLAVATAALAADWRCMTRGAATTSGDWMIDTPVAGCAASAAVSGAGAPVNGPPLNVRATVTGSQVRLDWDPPAGETVTGFVLEAGSRAGLADIVPGYALAASARSFVAQNVPNGVYYVRVRGNGATLGPPSADVTVRVGTTSCEPPTAPHSLTSTTAASSLTLTWDIADVGGAPASYVIEAGSAAGLADVLVADTGSTARRLTAAIPSRQLFVRVRARNACGTSGASNEVTVGTGPTTPPRPAPCSYSVDPASRSVSSSGGTFDVTVTTTAGCAWTPASLSPFITVLSPGSRTGTATASFEVAANTGAARTGSARISWSEGGQDIIVSQAAAPSSPPPLAVIDGPRSGECLTRDVRGPIPCQFSGLRSENATRWEWDFRAADGTVHETRSGAAVSVTFPQGDSMPRFSSKLMTATLRVFNAAGESHVATLEFRLVKNFY